MKILKPLGLMLVLLGLLAPMPAQAESKLELDAKVKATVADFYKHVRAAKDLAGKSHAMLVFPEVYKAGIGIGGEYGEGALLVHGRTIAYYSTAAASIGFQLGAQVRSEVILFMNRSALRKFRASKGWKAGVDGSVALANLGADGSVDTDTARKPIIAFVFSNEGLMYNLTLEGSKFTRIDKK